MGIKSALPKYEIYFYNTVLCLATLWAGSWVLDVSSSGANRKAFKPSVKPGWYYFGRKRDSADLEWVMWFSTFREHILFALAGHVLFAKICSMSLVYMVYGMLAVWTSLGWTYVTLILSHCILLYSVSLVKIRWLCFVTGLCTLATFKCEPFVSWQAGFVEGDFDLRHIFFYGGCGFTIMRCMSFALENCERKDGNYSILELLKYNFYLPFFFFGPIMTFDKFYVQANKSDLSRKEWGLWNISLHGLTHLGVVIMVDLLFHFIGGDVWDHQHGVQTGSPGPSQAPKMHHSALYVVLVWAFFNCFGLNFELWTAKFFAMEPFASSRDWNVRATSRRIRAVFNTFNFWSIVLYNILALNSLDFAKLVAKRLLLKGFPFTTIIVMFVTYCLVQVIKERERRQALIDDPDPLPPAVPPTTSSSSSSSSSSPPHQRCSCTPRCSTCRRS
ncbi:hypothetical protein F7725_029123 [Dissostichus mawsoni]|uniref:Uncharacterized protein n=1 Tax=Dissostichus mawsoni TaxID=36200 RepID=A0A7J5XHK3_DISMA|nr:hypothetical protein F7725_029123 [Dissostichus mawsoni]